MMRPLIQMRKKPEAWMIDPYAPSKFKRWLWICVVVVVAYFLSVPPVTICVTTGWPLSTAYAKRGARPEGWMRTYRAPYEWLAGKAFAKGVLKGYEAWWMDLMVPGKEGTRDKEG